MMICRYFFFLDSQMAIDLTKSRRILPASMLDRSSYSIFSVIKQAIGKDLTRFSIPVIWNGNAISKNILHHLFYS
jgi:hypothetical protein